MTTPTTVSVRLQLRADTAANWTSANPTLLANELGRETDTGKIKIGDGSTAWSSLAYQAWATLPIAVASGGTGQTSYTNGQLLIGNTTGNTLTKATLTAGSGIAITNGTGSITVAASGISDAQIAADAEIAVSKLADGTARQLLQTDAAGTGVEWASNIDIPGTLDVTSAATFDSTIGASAGTASLPSITFTGDTNTGIYSPGADQVAISTGGSGRITVDGSGNVNIDSNTLYVDATNNRVGVGTTSPGAPLSVNGNAIIGPEAGTRLAVNLTENDKVELQVIDSTSTARALALTVGATEAARITAAGLVGIGVSSVSSILHVNAGTGVDTNVRLQIGSAGSHAKHTYSDATNTVQWTSGYRSSTNTFGINVGDSFNSTGLTIDSSGRLGIGTTAPGAPLEVIGTAGTISARATTGVSSQAIQIYNNGTDSYIDSTAYGAGSGGGIAFRRNGTGEMGRFDTSGRLLVGTSSDTSGGNGNALLQVVSSGPGRILPGRSDGNTTADQAIGAVDFRSFAGSVWESVATITALSDGVSGSGDKPGRLTFSTTADGAASPTERMRINNTGTVTINGTTSVAGGTHTIQDSGSSPNTLRLYNNTDSNNTTNRFLICDTGASVLRAEIRSNGGLANYSANNINLASDIRLKKDIAPLSTTWSKIKEIEVVNFRYKDCNEGDPLLYGVIAQQVQPVVPELVVVTREAQEAQDAELDDEGNVIKEAVEATPDYYGIREQPMYWLAIKALQEAMERIEQLEAKVASLETP